MSIKVGVIGCGSIAKYRHLPEFAANPYTEIVAVCDPVEERAREMAEKYGAKVFSDYRDVIAIDDIDAISVCTPNYLHAPVTIAALKAGKHVLCEKPMATSLEDAREMIRAAEESGRHLMIGHNQRLAPAHVKAKEILKSGRLGKVYTFRTIFGHSGPESWSADKGPHTWFFKKEQAYVGSMGDLGVHKADLIRWLLDEKFVEVAAFVETLDKKNEKGELISVDDNAVCLLKGQSGVVGTLTASWTYKGGEDNSTTIYCEKGVMKIYADPEYQLIIHNIDGSSEYYKIGAIQTNEKQTKSGVIDAFVDCIVNNHKPEISGEEGYEALKIVMACMEAAQKKTVVKID